MTHAYTDTLVSHEWLAPHGGSENVFEAIAAALPGASLQCLWNDAPGRFGTQIPETWLARSPLRRSKAAALPFLSRAWRSVELSPYSRIVASSHAFGHHLASRAAAEGRAAFAYVHTPARYVWNPELDERGRGGLARAIAATLKGTDRRHVRHDVSYAANSEFVRDRIRTFWDVDAAVIYPPVAIERIQGVTDWRTKLNDLEADQLQALPDNFVLGASRLVRYKRIDLAMKVGEALDLPVVIAGSGPDETDLRRYAETLGVPVHFLGRISDEMLYTLYQRAELFVFMAVEDFGIMPVEAMSAGTPVLVNVIGGASESVRLTQGGATARAESTEAELREVAGLALQVDRGAMSNATKQFSEQAFQSQIVTWVDERCVGR